MIDFRYHLVSLISVFLALAVGIALGAGPLRESLGTQLASQVEQLRVERDQLRDRSDALATQNDQLGTYISGTAPTLVRGTLEGRDVAVVTDDASTRESVEQIVTLVGDAGGQVGARVMLGTMIWDPATADARSDTVTALRDRAPGLRLTGEDDTQRIASAIQEVLTRDGDQLSTSQREAAVDVLTSAGAVTIDGKLTAPVDGVLYAGAAPSELTVTSDDTAAAGARAQALNAAQAALLLGLTEGEVPTVVAGATPGSDDTTGAIRVARGDARFATISSADGLQRPDGPPIAVLALAEQFRGGAGSYGTGAGAQSRVPALGSSAGAAATTSDGGGAG
ncbi:copper transporter [Brachybacterium sp. AOP25-B2-12]|uniref:copper transporter n=1 Tax=Brachybacterium sp. AOP25-B2-12 TaxID=3457710 RepID=UPI004033206B